MTFKSRKRIAAKILKCSPKRIRLDRDEMEEIKEAITTQDIRGLVKDKVITAVKKKGVSRARSKIRHIKRTKGQRKGEGKRKGKSTAREPKKALWMRNIRLQRSFLKELKEKGLITTANHRMLYLKSKGGFFRSKRHITIYINEHKLITKKE